MASVEDMEQMKRVIQTMQKAMEDMVAQHKEAERNLKLDIETMKSERHEQDIQMEELRREMKKTSSVMRKRDVYRAYCLGS